MYNLELLADMLLRGVKVPTHYVHEDYSEYLTGVLNAYIYTHSDGWTQYWKISKE